jgi:predicted dehydrogenase
MQDESNTLSRRSFLKRSTAVGTGVAGFTIIKPELVRGAGNEKLKAGLIGCGGRGTQAVANLLSGDPNVELVVMGDIFEDRLEGSLRNLHDPEYLHRSVRNVAQFTGKPVEELIDSVKNRVTVDPELRFVSFEAFKKVLGSDIDIVMLCTPPGYRPEHFEAAVEARKHVFCEKPFGTDPVGVRRFMAAAKKSEELKLTVVAGAQRHYQKEYVETIQKIKDGAIGDVAATYAYWVGTPVLQFLSSSWPGPKGQRDPKWGDMTWEHRNWYSFVWICGDQVVEQHLHNIDVSNWVMGTHPVKVAASGGAIWRPREAAYGNIYDHLTADFVYENGVHMSSYCRQYPSGLYTNISELAVGSKGRSNCRDMGTPGMNPYVQEHIEMLKSIRGDRPYINQAMSVAESTMTCIMARESAYSGLEITWDMIMASKLDLQPKAFGYDLEMNVPPLPVPGEYKFI